MCWATAIGLVVYKVLEDGTLDGLWTIAGKDGNGTEVLTPGQLSQRGRLPGSGMATAASAAVAHCFAVAVCRTGGTSGEILPGHHLLPISNNLRGAIFMSISMIGFTANDTMTKSASAS